MEQYNSIQQLLKKEDGQDKKPIFPTTVVQAVFDAKTGASLEAILAQFNSIYVQYQGSPEATRNIIPVEMRRAGLTITYMNMDSETITERASSAVQKDNDHWGLDVNWSRIDELSLSGDIAVSAQGTWIINGVDTRIKAVGPKGDNGLTPWLKTIDNKLHYSYDNETWEECSDYLVHYFRFNATSSDSQSGTIGKIQISKDKKTWIDLSPEFRNYLRIQGYVATASALPANQAVGTIYGVGPTYDAADTGNTNPIYRIYVYNGTQWIDNGQFTSIAAGVVQEMGDSETEVMSQKAVSEKFSELSSGVDNYFQFDVCNSKKASAIGWGNISVERDIEVKYDGKTISADKVTFKNSSPNGNMLSFNTGFNILNAVGTKVNFCILLYSEVEGDVSSFIYPDVGAIDSPKIHINKGWNKIHTTCLITKEYTENFNIQYIFQENSIFIGESIYVKPLWYIGDKKIFATNLYDIFLMKEEGKSLIPNNVLLNVESLSYVDIKKNITKQKSVYNHAGTGFYYTQSGGVLSIKKIRGEGGAASEYDYAYINFLLDDNIVWEKNHEYYIAIDMIVNSDSKLKNDKFYGRPVTPKYNEPQTVGTTNFVGELQKGVRGLYKAKVTIDKSLIDTYPMANRIYFQFGKYETDDEFDGMIYNVFVTDLGEIGSKKHVDWDTVDEYVTKEGLNNKSIAEECMYSMRSKFAEKFEATANEIDLWGDSLTAINWNNYLQEILGRSVYAHGYGGKTSTYIRDLYLSGLNKNRTQVIWVGRNNYHETDVVVDDIKDMVNAFGGHNFIIMSPPNGCYGRFSETGNGAGEMKGGDGYKKFIELEDRLSSEYPSNYLNIRKAVIQGWRMGNVKLLESFAQPNIGGIVQVAVSDADFLTTYNASDLETQGEAFMKKIRIGINGKYDVYSVISKDDSTHLTIKLEVANYKQPNEVVDNIIDSGGNHAIKHLRVMQNADYMCWLNDTTLSTYRSDGIHITEDGRKLVAEIVARKIESMKI